VAKSFERDIQTVFRNIERFAFLTFKFSKSIHCPFSELKTFSLHIWRMGSQKIPLPPTDFKNVNLIFVKSAHTKNLSQKSQFSGQNFFWV
jgi:hypothetical protein